ncbi:Single-stranded DNA-binding protein, mitochondrial [Halotydeus destructor]|nr:Single-stranded DNA-binding protein, mitochondrial [Halotydeus destructor]
MIFGNVLKSAARSIRMFSSDAGHNIEKSVNRITLLGRVGTAPTSRGSEEHPVVIFTLATNSTYRQTGEIRQKTEWHRVSVFKPFLRETILSYVQKGSRLYIEGKLAYGNTTDASGNAVPTATIIADDVIFVSKSSSEE